MIYLSFKKYRTNAEDDFKNCFMNSKTARGHEFQDVYKNDRLNMEYSSITSLSMFDETTEIPLQCSILRPKVLKKVKQEFHHLNLCTV